MPATYLPCWFWTPLLAQLELCILNHFRVMLQLSILQQCLHSLMPSMTQIFHPVMTGQTQAVIVLNAVILPSTMRVSPLVTLEDTNVTTEKPTPVNGAQHLGECNTSFDLSAACIYVQTFISARSSCTCCMYMYIMYYMHV